MSKPKLIVKQKVFYKLLHERDFWKEMCEIKDKEIFELEKEINDLKLIVDYQEHYIKGLNTIKIKVGD